MYNREEIVEHLKAYVDCHSERHSMCDPDCALYENGDWYGHGGCDKYAAEFIDDALALLKEQEPVKPMNVRWEMNIRGGTCPRCLNWVQRSYNYCPFCGKAVKWDD